MPPGLLTLLWVFLVIGLLWAGVVAAIMGIVLLQPRRMTDARALIELRRLSPADLGLEFQDLPFTVRDQRTGNKIKIAGWWIPHPQPCGKCVVIVHGYSDAKVGGIAWAPLFKSLGYSILAVDLRAHGESDGPYCTAGFWERHDLNQVIDQLLALHPDHTRELILFGVSIGAATTAAAAVSRRDLVAVILECPFHDYITAVKLQATRLSLPGDFFQNLAFKVAQWIAGCDFSAVRPIDTIPKIPFPLMLIQAGDDPFLTPAQIDAMAKAVQSRNPAFGPSVEWMLPDVHHVIAICQDPAEYRRRIEQFLDSAFAFSKTVENHQGVQKNADSANSATIV